MKSLAIAVKDLRIGFRSRFLLLMMFVVPLLITGLIYLAFGGLSRPGARPTLPTVNVALVNLDQGTAGVGNLGERLEAVLGQAGFLRITRYAGESEARAAVGRQQAAVAAIIPEGFSAAAVRAQGGATVRLIPDPTLTVGPQIVRAIVQSFCDALSGARITGELAGEMMPAARVELAQRYAAWAESLGPDRESVIGLRAPRTANRPVNPLGRVMGNVMAGMLVFFVFYSAAYAALSVLTEDEQGTLARLFATPTGRGTVLAGKLLMVFFTVAIQSVALMAASALLFGINWGRPLNVALALLGVNLCAGGFGILLISLVRNTRQSGPVLGGGLTVSGMLGGLFTTMVPNMPAAFKTVSLAMPQGWALRATTLSVAGSPTSRLIVPVLVLVGIGLVSFTVGTLIFRRRFA